MAGLMAPGSFPIRKVDEKAQMNGRVLNPVRYMEIGGMKGPGVWFKESGGDAQSPQGNSMRVMRATDVRGSKRSIGMNVDTA